MASVSRQRCARFASRRSRTPSAESPIVPVTTMLSPALAVERRTMAPFGTTPNAVIDTAIGPGVRSVSPPRSGQA